MKRIRFTPDATIEAAESGARITDTKLATFYERFDDTMLFFVGLEPKWWDIILYVLQEHPSTHARSIAEAIENAQRITKMPE